MAYTMLLLSGIHGHLPIMLGTACRQGSPVWGTVLGMSALGSCQDRIPPHAEVSSAHVLLSFCLEICAIKATKDIQGL